MAFRNHKFQFPIAVIGKRKPRREDVPPVTEQRQNFVCNPGLWVSPFEVATHVFLFPPHAVSGPHFLRSWVAACSTILNPLTENVLKSPFIRGRKHLLPPGQWRYYINSEELNWGEGPDKGACLTTEGRRGWGAVCAVAGSRQEAYITLPL